MKTIDYSIQLSAKNYVAKLSGAAFTEKGGFL